MERFGDYVRRIRIDKEMTIASVSELLGFSAVHVSDIERGKKNPPSPSKIRVWAKALDLDPVKLTRMAVLDVDSVRVDVSHDPQKAEIALAFARRLHSMSVTDRDRLMKLLGQEEDNE